MNEFKPHTNGHWPPASFDSSLRVEYVPFYGGGPLVVAGNLVPWKLVKEWRHVYAAAEPAAAAAEPTGAKVNYYRVQVKTPIHDDQAPYIAECGDVATALGLTGDEFECFKAIWRRAAGRQGMLKTGVSDAESQKYNAEKAAHYGARVLASFNDYGI
jgi:hypothetical protein